LALWVQNKSNPTINTLKSSSSILIFIGMEFDI
jgi:hypothetical protein